MPITPYLDGFAFDAEARRVMGIAFEMACAALRIGRTDPAAAKAAERIIELAKDGERNPDLLCDGALKVCARHRHSRHGRNACPQDGSATSPSAPPEAAIFSFSVLAGTKGNAANEALALGDV